MTTCITDKEFQALKNKPSKGMGHTVATLDAGGSLLLIVENGVKGMRRRWVVRYNPQPGKRAYKGLGNLAKLPRLRDARDSAEAFVRGMREGVDIRKTNDTSPALKTITALLPRWIEALTIARDGRGENPELTAKRFRKHFLPTLGKLTPDDLTPEIVAAALNGVEGKRRTVTKVTQILNNFLSWCIAAHHKTENSMPTSANLLKPFLRQRPDDAEAQPFLLPADMPRFIAVLTAPESMHLVGSLALLFLILCCGRSAMVRGVPLRGVPPLTWGQLETNPDDGQTVLRIPAAQMKIKNQGDFYVPLSKQCCQLLDYMRSLGLSDSTDDTALVFPNTHGRPLCENTVNHRIKALDKADIEAGGKGFRDPNTRDENGAPKVAVQHGICRATFMTWAVEKDVSNRTIAEACLSHHIMGDQYKGAYNRSPYYQGRKKLLQEWADFCFSEAGDVFAKSE